MKRLAALLLLLFLLPLPAAAEDPPQYVADFVNEYNSCCPEYAVPPLPIDGWHYNGAHYTVKRDDYSFSIDYFADTYLAMVTVPIENGNMDFFAVCACMSAAVRGNTPDNYADILTAYFALRNMPDERITHKSLGGMTIMQQTDDILFFGVTN